MTGDQTRAEESGKRSFLQGLRIYREPRALLMLALGFSSGLPYLLVFSTLSTWLREAGISRTDIGLMSYVGLAYTIKFLWAPVLDHLHVPVLHRLLGRRRAWMLVAQAIVAIGLLGIASSDPHDGLTRLVICALIVAFGSATQDINVDAWRIEAAPREKQGAMAGVYQLGYRLALIAAGAGALYVAEYASWHMAYSAMALLMGIGATAALLSPRLDGESAHVMGEEAAEAAVDALHLGGTMARVAAFLYRTVVAPFVDFFGRHGLVALLILALIGCYRVPDFVMGVMANPLYIDLGFSKTEIANISKLYGVWMSISGALIGGAVVIKIGILRTMLIGVVAVSCANLLFAWLAGQGHNLGALTLAISAENIAGGFAGTALIAYMSSLTNTAFTATQYALFSSFYALPGKLIGGQSGRIVDAVGYENFFHLTAAMGIPAILLVLAVMNLDRDLKPPAVAAQRAS